MVNGNRKGYNRITDVVLDVKSVKIPNFRLYVKKYNKNKKNLANIKDIRYTEKAVTLIAVKREVAVRK